MATWWLYREGLSSKKLHNSFNNTWQRGFTWQITNIYIPQCLWLPNVALLCQREWNWLHCVKIGNINYFKIRNTVIQILTLFMLHEKRLPKETPKHLRNHRRCMQINSILFLRKIRKSFVFWYFLNRIELIYLNLLKSQSKCGNDQLLFGEKQMLKIKRKKQQQTKIRPAPVESLPNLSSSKIFPPPSGSMLTLLFIRKINLHH